MTDANTPTPAAAPAPVAANNDTPSAVVVKAAGQSFVAKLETLGEKAKAAVLKDLGLVYAEEKASPGSFSAGIGFGVLLGVALMAILIIVRVAAR